MSSRITRFGPDPSLAQEVATKAYVDASGGSSPLTTKGDLFGFDTVDDRIPIGTNDQVLTADSAQGLGLKWADAAGGGNTFARVVKSVDQTKQSDTTLADDDELVVAVNANKAYSGLFMLFMESGATPDIKFAWSVPSSATMISQGGNFSHLSTATADMATTLTKGTNGSQQCVCYIFRLLLAGTAGNVAFQWAQNVSTATDTTVGRGTFIVLWEELP